MVVLTPPCALRYAGVRLSRTTLLRNVTVRANSWIHSSIIGWGSTIGRWVGRHVVMVVPSWIQESDNARHACASVVSKGSRSSERTCRSRTRSSSTEASSCRTKPSPPTSPSPEPSSCKQQKRRRTRSSERGEPALGGEREGEEQQNMRIWFERSVRVAPE